jgi:hypothetical protein
VRSCQVNDRCVAPGTLSTKHVVRNQSCLLETQLPGVTGSCQLNKAQCALTASFISAGLPCSVLELIPDALGSYSGEGIRKGHRHVWGKH